MILNNIFNYEALDELLYNIWQTQEVVKKYLTEIERTLIYITSTIKLSWLCGVAIQIEIHVKNLYIFRIPQKIYDRTPICNSVFHKMLHEIMKI